MTAHTNSAIYDHCCTRQSLPSSRCASLLTLSGQVADWVGRARNLHRLQWGCIPCAGQRHGSVLGERAMSLYALHAC